MTCLFFFAQHVTDTADRMQQAGFALQFQSLAQVANVHIQYVAFTAKVISPYAIVDHFTGEHLTRVAQEELNQVILFCREGNGAPAANCLAGGGIEGQVSKGEGGGALRLGAA